MLEEALMKAFVIDSESKMNNEDIKSLLLSRDERSPAAFSFGFMLGVLELPK
jgi:hypothetical protein